MTKGDNAYTITKTGKVQIGVVRDFFTVNGKSFAVIQGEVLFIQEVKYVKQFKAQHALGQPEPFSSEAHIRTERVNRER